MNGTKIKVYLQYPWKFKDSPYYKNLIKNPPEDIKYLNAEKEKNEIIINKKIFWLFDKSKKVIKIILNLLKLERPNTKITKANENFDLIHCAHCLSKNKNKPWVADIEMYGSLFIAKKRSNKIDDQIKKIILRKNCKKIMPWSEGIKETIVRWVPEIEKKMEVVYPAIPSREDLRERKGREKLRVIFVSRYFYTKGGLMVLEIMKKLNKKYPNLEFIVVAEVPEKIKNNYTFIKFYNLLPQKKLFGIMENSDLFIYPSISETFGFSLLEAMSFGIPIITIETEWTPSVSEIVINNKTGLIEKLNRIPSQRRVGKFEREVIGKLFNNCCKIIDNEQLRGKISENCLKEIEKGRFSVIKRNKQLKKIYEEALK